MPPRDEGGGYSRRLNPPVCRCWSWVATSQLKAMADNPQPPKATPPLPSSGMTGRAPTRKLPPVQSGRPGQSRRHAFVCREGRACQYAAVTGHAVAIRLDAENRSTRDAASRPTAAASAESCHSACARHSTSAVPSQLTSTTFVHAPAEDDLTGIPVAHAQADRRHREKRSPPRPRRPYCRQRAPAR